MQALIKEKGPLVLVQAVATSVVVVLSKLFFSLLIGALYHELVLKLLAGSPDGGNGVFVNEFRIAFRRKRTDKVELALGDFGNDLFGCVAKQIFTDCGRVDG